MKKKGPQIILKKIAVLLFTITTLFVYAPSDLIYSEGVSADVLMTFSKSVLNIGKTYSLIISVKPNTSANIELFDLVIGVDLSKVEIIKTGTVPKTGHPSNVPPDFSYTSNMVGNEVLLTGEYDDGTKKMINATSSTPIIIIYFKVRDTAIADSTVDFTINDASVTQRVGIDSESISLTFKSPKTGTIGARLDTNTYLSSLASDVGVLAPDFAKATTAYSIDVPEDCDTVKLTAAADSAKSSFKIAGGEGLDYGPNTMTIKVTAEDPDYVRIYTITINRASPPEPTATATPEPTAAVTSTPEDSSEDVSSAASAESEDEPVVPVDVAMWKELTMLFAGLFLVMTGATVWLAIDKVRNRDKIIKVRHM